jgi:hypothetical protein
LLFLGFASFFIWADLWRYLCACRVWVSGVGKGSSRGQGNMVLFRRLLIDGSPYA